MVKPITLFTSSAGLNTRLDPQRLQAGYDNETGVSEFAQLVNVSIDDRGLPELRPGFALAAAGEFHSLFCDGGDCFVVQERTSDAAIMRVNPGLSLTAVRTGLTKGLRMAWAQNNTDTFYSNGAENGYIRGGINFAWPTGSYQGPDDDRDFVTLAPANHIAFFKHAMIVVAIGSGVFVNHSPFQFGLFNPRSGYIGFQSRATMLAQVQGGIFVSDCERTWFLRKLESWYHFKQELVAEYPALEWSLAHRRIALRDAGLDVSGFGRIWGSPEGLCLGADDGTFINLTKEKVTYPSGYSSGATMAIDKVAYHTAII